jgi:DASH complex subunit DAD1
LEIAIANLGQVGNEFGSVEALWSQFENFMGRPEEEVEEAQGKRHVSGESEGEDESVAQ